MKRALKRGRKDSVKQEVFTDILLVLLYWQGGICARKRIFELIERDFGEQFSRADWESPGNGKKIRGEKIRWQNHVDWVRQKLVDEKLIKQPEDSGRGTWALTDSGMSEAARIAKGWDGEGRTDRTRFSALRQMEMKKFIAGLAPIERDRLIEELRAMQK